MIWQKKQWSSHAVLATMLVGAFAASVNQGILTSALPAVMHDFNIGAVLGQLLTTSYVYTLGISAALSAFLCTRFNTRRLFLGALATLIAGCALALFSSSYPMLLAARLMQACGTGVLVPLVQVVALEMYPKDEYGRALGLVGLVFGFAPAIGPTLSGALADALGWHDIFMVLGIVAVGCLAVALLVVRDVVPHEKQQLDTRSVLLYTLGLVAFMAGVTGLEQFGFFDARAFGPALVGVALIAVFVLRQRHLPEPFLKLALFKSSPFRSGVVLMIVAQMVMMASGLQVPLYLEAVHGLPAAQAGLMMLPGALCVPVLSPITGRLYDRFGGKLVGAVGFLLLAVGTGGFVVLTGQDSPLPAIVLFMARMVGVSLVLTPMMAYCMSDLSEIDLAQGSAIANSLRQVCGALGSSITTAIVAHVSAAVSPGGGVSMAGFAASFSFQAALLGISFVATLLFVHHQGHRKARSAQR